MKHTSLSVVIPAYNAAGTIERCLHSLLQQTYPPHEIILVDGGSTDSTIEKAVKFKDVQIIFNEGRLPGPARNMGGENATGEILFFYDSDCVAEEKVLEYHVKAYESRDDIAGVMGSIGNAGPRNNISDFVKKQVMVGDWRGNLRGDGTISSSLSGANFSIKKHDFNKNRFRDDLVSYEDAELLIRLNRKGLKIFYEPRAIVYHHHPKTVKELLKRFRWYGEGIFQVDKIHGKDFRNRYRFFSPARYIKSPENHLKEAVLVDNRLLCKDCIFSAIQKCKIQSSQLMENKIQSDISLHRITCLAIAAGILKQRTGIDYLRKYLRRD